MKIKFNDMVGFINFYQDVSTQRMDFQTAYKLNKLNKIITEEYEFFRVKFDELINEYAEIQNGEKVITADGNVKIQEDRIDECQNKLEELQSIEVEIPDIEFDINEFRHLKLSPETSNAIFMFIKKEA